MSEQKGIKYDQGKPMIGLIPPEALIDVANVFTYGANKYSSHNWRGGLKFSRLYDAVLRHLFAFIGGEDKDPESGLPHLAHACCGLMMLLTISKTREDLDDRFKG